MPAHRTPAHATGPDPAGARARPRRRGLVALLAAAAVLAAVLSVLVATRSGAGDPASGGCPVEALTCAPGQADPADSRSPSASSGSPAAGDAARTSGIERGTPTRDPAPGQDPSASGTASPGGRCASFSACGFPDAHSTGPRLSMTPHRTGAMTVRKDGTVIRRWDITGSLDIYANDVTVIDSRITSDNWWGVNLRSGYHGLRILHTTITAVPGKGPDNGGVDYAVSNMGTSSVEVGWCDVSVFGDALSMGQGDLHDNYVHDITPFRNLGGEWQHTNAVISNGGGTGGLTIRHNTLLNPTPVDQGASGSVGLFADTGPVTAVTVQDNWLAGGAYALYGGGQGATGVKVTGNIFSTEYHPGSGGYGPVAAWNAGGSGNVWSDNHMSDGRPVVPGATS
ncbi:MAG: hypothetical protein FWE75_00700 [Actinomycetia bacterium]|nr:hypothetical protein [Actinomycetes bacterium]